jgi:hypothetical protein
MVLELLERSDAPGGDELLRRREAVDALLGVDDEDPVGLVDAVDRTHVHARAVFDIDAGLGDDVGHNGRTLPSGVSPPEQAERPFEPRL